MIPQRNVGLMVTLWYLQEVLVLGQYVHQPPTQIPSPCFSPYAVPSGAVCCNHSSRSSTVITSYGMYCNHCTAIPGSVVYCNSRLQHTSLPEGQTQKSTYRQTQYIYLQSVRSRRYVCSCPYASCKELDRFEILHNKLQIRELVRGVKALCSLLEQEHCTVSSSFKIDTCAGMPNGRICRAKRTRESTCSCHSGLYEGLAWLACHAVRKSLRQFSL